MAGLTIIDPGHNAEKIMKPRVADWLTDKLNNDKYETKVHISSINTEPFVFM
ncbi:hypothetical protein D3C78_1988040 [compost metagenome]